MNKYLKQVNKKMEKMWTLYEYEEINEELLEDFVRAFLSKCWNDYEKVPEFWMVCEVLEIHKEIVSKIYDEFMRERV